MSTRSLLIAVVIATLTLSAAPSAARAADGPEHLTFVGVLTGVGYGGGGGATSYGPIDVEATFTCTGGRCTIATFNGAPATGPRAAWNFRGSSGSWSTPPTGDVCAMTEERAQSGTASLADGVLTIVVERHSIPIVRCDEFRSREVGGNTDTLVLALVDGDLCEVDNSCTPPEPAASDSEAVGPPAGVDDSEPADEADLTFLITLLVVLGIAAAGAVTVGILRARSTGLTGAAKLFAQHPSGDAGAPLRSEMDRRRAMLNSLQQRVDVSAEQSRQVVTPPKSTQPASDLSRAADHFAERAPEPLIEPENQTARARRMFDGLARYFGR